MPVVTFILAEQQTSGGSKDSGPLSAKVPAGTSLLDAAVQAGVTITAPCGGEGVCGECRVRVTTSSSPSSRADGSTVTFVPRGYLTPRELAEGWVLACSTRVIADVTVEVPQLDAQGEGQIAIGDSGPGTMECEPPASKLFLRVDQPSLDNSFSDFERLTRAVRAAGGPKAVSANLEVLRGLAEGLRADDHCLTVTITEQDEAHPTEIIRVEPGDTTARQVGLAIDVGTTTCAVSLVDLTCNHVLGTAADYNGQLARGADIISRISYAKDPERRDELRRLVLDTLNCLISDLCDQQEIVADQIDNAVVAGNPTMVHLLLGLDPKFIRLEPYTPTVNLPPHLRAGEVGLKMNPIAYVHFAPGVGSYVGGDITAGLLQTALAGDGEEVRVFIDFGTNGEVVVGTGEWLMACAASAGPAFEGTGVSCGMRGQRGAIERVRIDRHTGLADVSVIGGGRPLGVCGSGMVDLLAELWIVGLIDPSGKFDSQCPGLVKESDRTRRNLEYVIVPESQSGTGQAISIHERDVQNLLRTKAAVYAACALMLRPVDLDFDAISEVYVAGGFGRFLDVEKSIMIGMLPDLPLERFTYLGNASLTGARTLLCDASARRSVVDLANRITYLELNVDPAYMNEYTAALFLPHTDLDRFPSVAAALRARTRVGDFEGRRA